MGTKVRAIVIETYSSGGISSNSSKNNNKEELFYIVLCDLEAKRTR